MVNLIIVSRKLVMGRTPHLSGLVVGALCSAPLPFWDVLLLLIRDLLLLFRSLALLELQFRSNTLLLLLYYIERAMTAQ